MSSHVVVSGTGRTGTSFLVTFLDACGLDTGAEELQWFDRSRAGGERRVEPGEGLPYVVKDPWLWFYCREIDLSRIQIDALVIPMRDLEAAAASRVLQERLAMTETSWIDHGESDVFGRTPGGILYSLSVSDQARILAVGLHTLLQWAVANDVRTILLDFPRLVEDAEYLVSALWPILDGRVERDAALAAHARLADPSLIRVKPESEAARADAELDRQALVLRIHELDDRVQELQEHVHEIEGRRAAAETESAAARGAMHDLRQQLDQERSRNSLEVERLRRETQEELARLSADADEERRVASAHAERIRRDAEEATAELLAMRSTVSWRVTRVLRAVRRRLP